MKESGSRNSPGQFALDVSRSEFPDASEPGILPFHTLPFSHPHSQNTKLAGILVPHQNRTLCLQPSYLLKAQALTTCNSLEQSQLHLDTKPQASHFEVTLGLRYQNQKHVRGW